MRTRHHLNVEREIGLLGPELEIVLGFLRKLDSALTPVRFKFMIDFLGEGDDLFFGFRVVFFFRRGEDFVLSDEM